MADGLLGHFQVRSKFQNFRRSHFAEEDALLSKHVFDSWKMLSKIDGERASFLERI